MMTDAPSDFFAQYRAALANMDKPACVQMVLTAVSDGTTGLVDLYQGVLARALNELSESELGLPDAIWREHVRSEITRTVIECCYPAVVAEEKAREQGRPAMDRTTVTKKRVMIVLPAEEYHELGARMGADFFQLAGFETLFVGANTPAESILNGISHFKPDYVDLHVVNYYNLFKAKDLLSQIQRQYPGVRLLASGGAFSGEAGQLERFGPVCLVRSLADIEALLEETP
ncbi:MAG: cobalamin-dependent protein [Eubacteriales bacterium]|nr:cobalamin-dependent protein [Eubacteriales bacterium]